MKTESLEFNTSSPNNVLRYAYDMFYYVITVRPTSGNAHNLAMPTTM